MFKREPPEGCEKIKVFEEMTWVEFDFCSEPKIAHYHSATISMQYV